MSKSWQVSREKIFSNERCTTKAKHEIQMTVDCAKRDMAYQRDYLYNRLSLTGTLRCKLSSALQYYWIRDCGGLAVLRRENVFCKII